MAIVLIVEQILTQNVLYDQHNLFSIVIIRFRRIRSHCIVTKHVIFYHTPSPKYRVDMN